MKHNNIGDKLIEGLKTLQTNGSINVTFYKSENDLFYTNFIFSLYDIEFDEDKYNEEGISFPLSELVRIELEITKTSDNTYKIEGWDYIRYYKNIHFTIFKKASLKQATEFLKEFNGVSGRMPIMNITKMKGYYNKHTKKQPKYAYLENSVKKMF